MGINRPGIEFFGPMEKPAALPRRALRRHCFHRWRAGRRCSSPTVPRPPDRSWLSPPGPEVVGVGRRGRSRCAAAYCAGKLNKLALGDRFRGHLIAADSVEEATVESGSSSASGSPTAVGPCPRWVRSSTISGQVVAPTCRSLWCHNRARAAANNRYSITSSVLPSYLRRRRFGGPSQRSLSVTCTMPSPRLVVGENPLRSNTRSIGIFSGRTSATNSLIPAWRAIAPRCRINIVPIP